MFGASGDLHRLYQLLMNWKGMVLRITGFSVPNSRDRIGKEGMTRLRSTIVPSANCDSMRQYLSSAKPGKTRMVMLQERPKDFKHPKHSETIWCDKCMYNIHSLLKSTPQETITSSVAGGSFAADARVRSHLWRSPEGSPQELWTCRLCRSWGMEGWAGFLGHLIYSMRSMHFLSSWWTQPFVGLFQNFDAHCHILSSKSSTSVLAWRGVKSWRHAQANQWIKCPNSYEVLQPPWQQSAKTNATKK